MVKLYCFNYCSNHSSTRAYCIYIFFTIVKLYQSSTIVSVILSIVYKPLLGCCPNTVLVVTTNLVNILCNTKKSIDNYYGIHYNSCMDKEGKGKKTRKKHTIMLELETELHTRLKREAEKLYIPLSTLIRLWLVEKLQGIEVKKGE